MGNRRIPMGISRKEEPTKEFPLILRWVHFTKDSLGKKILQGNPL